MQTLSLNQLSKALAQAHISSVELTQHYIMAIEQHQDLNAFISIDPEQALIDAKRADKELKQGNGKTLTGIPMAVKDLFCTSRMYTTCASKMLAKFRAPYEATVVSKLRAEGSILLAKTNMDEFAMGSSNESSYFGPVKNPWDSTRVAGGSSGGSAASVSKGLIPFALGSDTGGSIRQPAAFCGISGIKPTYGLVSRYGMIAYASSLDQAGPMASRVEDLALLLQIMAGFDPKDSTSISKAVPEYFSRLSKPIEKVRIGLPTCFFQADVQSDIQRAILEALKIFEEMGAEIIEIDLTYQSLWIPTYYVLACAEASSNLSRYDGLRFGYQGSKKSNLTKLIVSSRSEGFGPETKRRILIGTHLLSANCFATYYIQAQKIRHLIQNELVDILNRVDLILGPTTPTCAFKLAEQSISPIHHYLADMFTVAANLAGLPALTIPVGISQGLPIGMQLMGKHFSEDILFNIAHQYQQQSSWHLVKPQ